MSSKSMEEDNLHTTADTKNECKTKSNKKACIKTKKKPKLEEDAKPAKKPKSTFKKILKKILNMKKIFQHKNKQKIKNTNLKEEMFIPIDTESVKKVLSNTPSSKSIDETTGTQDDVNVDELFSAKGEHSVEVISFSANQLNVNWSSDKDIKQDNNSEIQEYSDNDIQNSQTSETNQTKESTTGNLSSEIIKMKIIEEPTPKIGKNNLNTNDFTKKNRFYKEYMSLFNDYSTKFQPENTTLNKNTCTETENIKIQNIPSIENDEKSQISQRKHYFENLSLLKDAKNISICSDSKEGEPKNVETIQNITQIKTILTDIPEEIKISEEIENIFQPSETPNYPNFTECDDNLNMEQDVCQNKEEICIKETTYQISKDNKKNSLTSQFFTPKPFKNTKSGSFDLK